MKTFIVLLLSAVSTFAAVSPGQILAVSSGTTNALPTGITITPPPSASGQGTNMNVPGVGTFREIQTGEAGEVGTIKIDDGVDHSFRITAQTMSENINRIPATAPFSGIPLYTVSDTTNQTETAAVEWTDYAGVDFGTTLASDDTYRGFVRSGLNSGGVTQWDAVYMNGSSQWVIADANGTGTYPVRGIAVATVSTGNATTVLSRGTIRNDAWNWTPGGNIYLSATAGGLTQTAPSTTGDIVQVIGYALDADTMAVEISADYGTAP